MSYLLRFLRPAFAVTRTPTARVDEYARLNRPGLYGDAYVHVFVEDSTTRRRGGGDPYFVLEIADCTNTINLEFAVHTAAYRENSLFKADTLIGALQRFRDGLAAEVELAERSASTRSKGGARCRT
jgi:hypothetical protein